MTQTNTFSIMNPGNLQTRVADFIDIQSIGLDITGQLIKYIRLAPLGFVDNQLVGAQGMTITHPFYQYIGKATTIGELEEVPTGQVLMDTLQATVKKAVKDLAFSDEAILNSQGAVVNEGSRQLAISIADKIDSDIIELLRDAPNQDEVTVLSGVLEFTQASFARLRVAFGESIEEQTALVVSSANYGNILAMPEFVAVQLGQAFMSGHVGHVMGLNIVVSDRLNDNEAFLVREGAFGLLYKRHVNVEAEREMKVRGHRIGVDAHYVAYLRDSSRLAVLSVGGDSTNAEPVLKTAKAKK